MASNAAIDFSFYHLISGQDYPLVDTLVFDDFFQSHQNNSFVGLHNQSFFYRYEWYHMNDVINVTKFWGGLMENILCKCQSVLSRFLKIRKPLLMDEYKGSNWWSINGEMFMYIVVSSKIIRHMWIGFVIHPVVMKYFFIPSCLIHL